MTTTVEQEKHAAVVIPVALKWHQRLAAWLIHAVFSALMATWRVRLEDGSGLLLERGGPYILCVWHNRLSIAMCYYREICRLRRQRRMTEHVPLAGLISASKDGGLLADVLRRYGVQAIRGSSSRRGRQALLECISELEKGTHLAVTPDGPRGPCYTIQDGILGLAQVTGLPIIPMSADIGWKICLRSWDRFQIPLPFSKCILRAGPALYLPRDADDAHREECRRHLRERMDQITHD